MAANARSGAASQRLTALVLEVYGRRCWLDLPGCTRVATTKDHVIPAAHGGSDDMENLRPACQPCNSKRRDLAISGAGGINVVVIVGPPSPEQEAHALSAARPGDVVIVRDLLARAIAAPGSQLPARHIDKIVHRAYSAAMQQALTLNARCTVWLVHPVPQLKKLQEYARLRYRIHTIDPGRAVAEHQATIREDRAALADVMAWYARYPDGAASIERASAHRPTATVTRAAAQSATAAQLKPSRAW